MFGAIRRRLRARILRPDGPPKPLTIGGWLADLIKAIAMLIALGIFIVILTAGTPLFRSISLAVAGYRPIGSFDNGLVLAFFVIALPVSFLGFVFCMVITMWSYRSMNWIGSHLVASLAIVGPAFFALYWYFLGPQLNARQHLNTWPTQLELVSFNACAVEVEEHSSRTTAPVGRITVDLLNRANAPVIEAVFSVKAGSNWYHLSIHDLPAGSTRRIEVERDLGDIERELSGNFSGWAQRGAEIYWDRVRPRSAFEAKPARRSEKADVSPIGDCPRNDISGIWQGIDGAQLILSQRGAHPRGYVKGGNLEGMNNSVSGNVDSAAFEGRIQQHAGRVVLEGTFKLALTPDRRLQGAWTIDTGNGRKRSGNWSFTRIGPGPPAPRRR